MRGFREWHSTLCVAPVANVHWDVSNRSGSFLLRIVMLFYGLDLPMGENECCDGPCKGCIPSRSDDYLADIDTAGRYYPVDQILNFVAKTIGHGAPEPVALKRAEKKFGVDRGIIRGFWRGLQ